MGPAAVTGLMLALAKRKAKVDAVGVIAWSRICRGGDAIRPVMCLTSLSGPDHRSPQHRCESRLVLAGCAHLHPAPLQAEISSSDLATLTGRDLADIGFEHAGVFSNDDKLVNGFLQGAGVYTASGAGSCRSIPSMTKMIRSKIAGREKHRGANSAPSPPAQFLSASSRRHGLGASG